MKRKAILEKKKAINQILKSASAYDNDHLSSFPHFARYQKNGLFVYLKSGRGDKISLHVKHYIHTLLKINMERLYKSEWQAEEKSKRNEMVAPEARYLFIYEAPDTDANRTSDVDPIVGFVQYRFAVEEELPVLYVYELQLESRVQGKGLGEFLMQLIELIARKNCMSAVMLTVQTENSLAMKFYTSKLRYSISSTSPSRVDQLIGPEKSYEILCKVFDQEAKSVLED